MIASPCIPLIIAETATGVGGWQENDIIAALLILVLGMALGIGLICFLLVLHYMRTGRLGSRQGAWPAVPEAGERRYQTSIFSAPPRWLAVKSGNPYVVQAALGVHKPMPCSWEEGLNAAQERKLFISPAINGWVLVMGSHLPDPSDDVDHCFQFLSELSRKVGQVQFFSVNRAVNHHAWVQLQHGQVQRGYAWAGKTIWNQGRKSTAEMELGLRCYDYAQIPERAPFGQNDPLQHNTERVCLLARRWSIDPTALDVRRLKESPGITGEISRSKAH
jgi:hypothetical protein